LAGKRFGKTCSPADEILTHILLPSPPQQSQATFIKESRVCMDLAICSLTCLVVLVDDTCQYAWPLDNATYGPKISAGKDYYLRVLDITNPDTAYSSDDFISNKQFKIAGRIVLDALPTHPVLSEEIFFIDDDVTISWTRDGDATATYFDNFIVEYSTSNTFAAGVNEIGTYTFTQAQCDGDVSCQITWTLDDSDIISPNKDYYLRVRDPDDTDTADDSVDFGNPQFEIAGFWSCQ